MAIGLAVGVMALGVLGGPPAAMASAQCSNESRRVEQSVGYLPECRAYELVTNADRPFGEPLAVTIGSSEASLAGIEGAQAANDGARMAWDTETPLPGFGSTGLDFLSTRGATGWRVENLDPPQSSSANGLLCADMVGIQAWSPDLSKGILDDGWGQWPLDDSFWGEGQSCGHDEPRLAVGEESGFQNLFVRSTEPSSYQLVNVPPNGVKPPTPINNVQYFSAFFLGGSSDLSHVAFEEELKLTPEAPAGDDLYEWSEGKVSLVSETPGAILAGATKNTSVELATLTHVAANLANSRHAVSSTGDRLFFEAAGNLYVRENGATTTQIDKSAVVAPSPGRGGGGEFMLAAESGSVAFFLDGASAELTQDTVPNSGLNLYEYDAQSHALTDVTPFASAEVLGVSGADTEASYVYFVARGAFAPGAQAGQANMYVLHAGELTFIAALNGETDECDWATKGCLNEGVASTTTRISANGLFAGFVSTSPLTGYDNLGTATGQPLAEVYLYEAATGKLVCASCNPSGARPTAPGIIRYPSRPYNNVEPSNRYVQRNVSDNGQVFFESADALLPRDTDGKRNVYEYAGGQLYSISSGQSSEDSYFLDASENGDDVFFATTAGLVDGDTNGVYDIYDARVDGGYPEPVVSGASCAEGAVCREVAPEALAAGSLGSATFTGAGNIPSSKTTTRKPEPRKPKPRKPKRRCPIKRQRAGKHARRSVCAARHRSRTRPTTRSRAGGGK